MFKNSDNVFFYREQHEGRQMFNGFKKVYEGNTHQISKHKVFMSPQAVQSRTNERYPSPFLGKLINKQNQQSTGNYFKNSSNTNMSPMKLPLTPSKIKNVLQSPRGILKDNTDGIQFRNKSPISKQFESKKGLTNQYQTTRHQEQGFKLLNLNTKRGSLQYPSQQTFQCKTQEDKKHKNDVLDDIIKNCGKKQQQNQILNSTGMQFRPKSPFVKQTNRVKTLSNNYTNIEQNTESYIECFNNHGKQAKYKLLNSQNSYNPCFYCSKCAIILIQQGYNVQQLQVSQQPKVLSKDALQILQQLTSYENLRQLKYKHCQQYNCQLQNIDQYYNLFIKSIEQLRSRDKQIILEYQKHSLKQVQESMNNIQNILNQIHSVKIQIENKPEVIEVMKNYFEDHIKMYEQLLAFEQTVPNKNVTIVIDYSKIQNFKKVLLGQFSLMIQTHQTQQNLIRDEIGCSKGVAFSFEGGMLEEMKNQQKPFRDLFSGEEEPNFQVYQAEDEVVGDQRREEVKDGSCSPSFKKI